MAGRGQGYSIREPDDRRPFYTVRFRWPPGGREYELSTGTADAQRAKEEAARLYAKTVATEVPRPKQRAAGGDELERLVAQWLDEQRSTLDSSTVATYLGYAQGLWLPFFGGAQRLTTRRAEEYMRSRLTKVRAGSVRKELSALRGFVGWASERGKLPLVDIPGVPKRAVGTPYRKDGKLMRRRAPSIPISPQEVEAILGHLPEWSSSKRVAKFPIRARFIVAYETGLRPELIDALSTPEHYQRGGAYLNITAALDKGRWSRRVPLSERALRELDAVCPVQGLIFGAHDYRPHLRKAAKTALPPDRSKLFNGAHFRSARATHWLDDGAPITGVQFLLGHVRLETTARYIRAGERAALDVLKKR